MQVVREDRVFVYGAGGSGSSQAHCKNLTVYNRLPTPICTHRHTKTYINENK